MSKTQENLADLFHEGVLLSHDSEYDRAQGPLLECVQADPGNLEFVDQFLSNLTRKFPVGMAEQFQAPDPRRDTELSNFLAKRNWAEAVRLGARQLSTNPWHVPTLLAMAEACAGLDEHEVGWRYLKLAQLADPEDIELCRQGANSLARMHRTEEALNSWRQVEELNPEDPEAAHQIAQLTIEQSRQRACLTSLGEEISKADAENIERRRALHKSRTLLRFDVAKVRRMVAEPKSGVRRTPIQQLEAAIREFPGDAELYAQLSALYLDQGRDYDAEQMLTKALKETDNDARVRASWEDVTMLRLEKKIALARQHLEVADTLDTREALDELTSKRDRFETETFASRCQREPENALLRYQLGLRLKRAGKLREACQRFEEALHDPEQKPAAACELGACLQEFNDFPKAFKHYRLAVESATQPSQIGAKIQALYRAGALAARLKLFALAQRYLGHLLRIDPDHTEASDLMRDIQRHRSLGVN